MNLEDLAQVQQEHHTVEDLEAVEVTVNIVEQQDGNGGAGSAGNGGSAGAGNPSGGTGGLLVLYAPIVNGTGSLLSQGSVRTEEEAVQEEVLVVVLEVLCCQLLRKDSLQKQIRSYAWLHVRLMIM